MREKLLKVKETFKTTLSSFHAAIAFDSLPRDAEIITNAQEALALLDSIISMLDSPWQPIETAPKGELILIYTNKAFREVGKLTNITTEIWDGEKLTLENIMDYRATHWMPLPYPPAAIESIRDKDNG